MRIFLAILLATISVQSYAGLDDMMKIYNNPESAPEVAKCQKKY